MNGIPARQFKVYRSQLGGQGRWFMEGLRGGDYTLLLDSVDVKTGGGNVIEYEDEDFQVREMYVAELSPGM